jgi:opacity protein-like surface antigen
MVGDAGYLAARLYEEMRTALVLGLMAVLLAPTCVSAQGASASAPQTAPSSPRWELEGHGGLSWGTAVSDGSAALPAPGMPIPSLSPLFPSRRTSSWFFGDGAAMLNSVNAEFGVSARITPLDAVLTSLGLDYTSAAVLGVRFRRVLAERWSAEVSLDLLPGSGNVSEEFLSAVDETRTTFESAFRGLFDSGPFDAVDLSTLIESSEGSARELALTGAVNWHLGSGGGFVPYLTFGGGLISGMGSLSSVQLEGRYGFVVLPASNVPFHETDRVTLRFERGTTLVGLAGGGVRRNLSDRWGFKVDGRVLIGRENSRLLIDANPAVDLRAGGDFIESLTNPNIQFSNDPATGRVSTLSGPPLDGFAAFKGTGWQTRVLVTVGVFVRF